MLAWLESTAFSVWIRESPSMLAFPGILSLHTIGMGIVAGINGVIALRILGAAPDVPLGEMRRFLPMMWLGFWVNAASGAALLIGYPTKALTNPVFYVKLGCIAAALVLVVAIRRRVLTAGGLASAKRLAVASLVCWTGAITAGRLLAYTYRHLLSR